MWYQDKSDELDYAKPIVAVGGGNTFLLLPTTCKNYAWFDLNRGRYSCEDCFSSPDGAINALGTVYKVYNTTITIGGQYEATIRNA